MMKRKMMAAVLTLSLIHISHRLSTIKNAEKIIVLSEDGIEESGTHEELMDRKGTYEKLYNMQFHKDVYKRQMQS